MWQSMKQAIRNRVADAISVLQADGVLPAECNVDIQVERCRDPSHGDYAVNTAMMLARLARRSPRDVATALVAAMGEDPAIAAVRIAGPGFINIELSRQAVVAPVVDALTQGADYGRCALGNGQRVLLEYVSANPTGPLHVGHGRGAAFGSALAELLKTAGYAVDQEYYVNDAGRQMNILATSVWLRYLEQLGEPVRFPDNAYRGDYVRAIASRLLAKEGDALRIAAATVQDGLPPDGSAGGDKDIHIDRLTERMQALLGAAAFRRVLEQALNDVLDDIRDDLAGFRVSHDRYYSEQTLCDRGAVTDALGLLEERGALYRHDGALWFRSTAYGDEKDRVVERENGVQTYFATDIAYHRDKFARGYALCIDIFGADHHGYMARVRGALRAMDLPDADLDFRLVQFAILYRGEERLPMSTRSGEFVTLRALRDEVGTDAARFFYVLRKPEQHMDFDLELAKSRSNDNPVYYIQYAHARICSVMRQLDERGLTWVRERGLDSLDRLEQPQEQALITLIGNYPELIESAARAREPHQIAHYLRDLANAVHTYYNAHAFLVDDDTLRDARLSLVLAARQVLRNGLGMLHITAPEAM